MVKFSPLYLEKIHAAEQRGRQQGESGLLIKQLQRRFGLLSENVKKQIAELNLD